MKRKLEKTASIGSTILTAVMMTSITVLMFACKDETPTGGANVGIVMSDYKKQTGEKLYLWSPEDRAQQAEVRDDRELPEDGIRVSEAR